MITRTAFTRSTKSRNQGKTKLIALGIIVTLAFLSCEPILMEATTGTLSLSLGDQVSSRTMLPDIDMNVHQFLVAGDGPNNAAFSETSTGGSLMVTRLVPGVWTITVTAKNEAGETIGTGSGSTEIQVGETAPLTIVVNPLDGDGTLDIEVAWPYSDLPEPTFVGQVLPKSGNPIDLEFTNNNDGTASAANVVLGDGYYTVTVQLFDGDVLAAGAADVARIAMGGTTSGTVTFSSVKKSSGGTSIIIDPEMDEPLTIVLTGANAKLIQGETMTINASVVEDVTDVTYEWFIDGASVGTGASYTVPSDLDLGYYRIDVVATSTSTGQSGAYAHEFEVTEVYEPVVVTATEFTLYWDPPAGGGDLDHYNVYYCNHGESGWTFLDSAPASPSPSFTVTDAILPYGLYDFAVTSVSTSGLESELHTSLDPTADPSTGWYVDWRAP